MPLLRYTLLRLLLLAVTGGVLYLVGLRDIWLLLAAFLISGAISLVALSRYRDAVSMSISARQEAINQRIAQQQPPSSQDES
jgi:membrane protein implicated in regulation of membrane protease activity